MVTLNATFVDALEGTIQQYLLDPQNYPLDRVADRIIAHYGAYPKGSEDE